jgi:hypothetical protein
MTDAREPRSIGDPVHSADLDRVDLTQPPEALSDAWCVLVYWRDLIVGIVGPFEDRMAAELAADARRKLAEGHNRCEVQPMERA